MGQARGTQSQEDQKLGGLAVKSTVALAKDLGSVPAPNRWLTTVCDSGPRASKVLPTSRASVMHAAQHTQGKHSHTLRQQNPQRRRIIPGYIASLSPAWGPRDCILRQTVLRNLRESAPRTMNSLIIHKQKGQRHSDPTEPGEVL